MVLANSDRLVSVTDARNTFNVLLTEAREGRMTHIVKGSEVVAHLVPATARIIDQDALLTAMATAMLHREVETISQKRDSGSSVGAGIDTGRLFVWAWRTDVHLFDVLFAQFVTLLSASGGRPYNAAEAFDLVRGAMSSAGLGDSEVGAADRHTRTG